MNLAFLRNRGLVIGLALAVLAGVFVLASSLGQQSAQPGFQPGISNSLAFQTITVSAASVWNVEMEITYSDQQRQAYLNTISRRIVSTGSAEAWRPTQHLSLKLTVSKWDRDSLQPVLEETINSEPFYGSGDHAGFLEISELQLQPGKYRVSIQTLKGDPGLSEFGARLLVNRRWE